MRFREASPEDRPFIIESVLAAERSGTARSLYEALFGIDESQTREMLNAMLDEDLPGSELSLGSFTVACEGDECVAACAAWVEGNGMQSSRMLKSLLLSRAVGAEAWSRAAPRLAALEAVEIGREPGALQLESIYVAPDHRGRGLIASLLSHVVESQQVANPGLKRAQILSILENQSSAKAFERAGFARARVTRSSAAGVTALLPGSGRILWERTL
jgi:GNAT superfamily N-acetyltransferase